MLKMWTDFLSCTPFIICLEVEVSCVLVWDHAHWLGQNKTQNLHFQADDKRCIFWMQSNPSHIHAIIPLYPAIHQLVGWDSSENIPRVASLTPIRVFETILHYMFGYHVGDRWIKKSLDRTCLASSKSKNTKADGQLCIMYISRRYSSFEWGKDNAARE